MADEERVQIIVRCTRKERQLIKARAKRDRRSLSGYILKVLMDKIEEPWSAPRNTQ